MKFILERKDRIAIEPDTITIIDINEDRVEIGFTQNEKLQSLGVYLKSDLKRVGKTL